MTRTGPTDVVMPAYHRTVPGWPVPAWPVPAWPGSHEPGSGWADCRESLVAGTVLPGSASLKPAHPRFAGRSGRLRPSCPPRPERAQTARPPHPPCPRQPALAHPIYSNLLEPDTTSICGWSFDPGRDMLCIFTSPPRWLQWP
jgi:hypothetical protein